MQLGEAIVRLPVAPIDLDEVGEAQDLELLRDDRRAQNARIEKLLGAFEADHDDVSVRHDDYFAGRLP